MSVRAKFKCHTVSGDSDGSTIALYPVTGGSAENDSFFRYTPGGQIRLSTINPKAAEQFAPGSEYFVDFTPVLAS